MRRAAVSHALLLSRDCLADCLAGGGATNAHPPGHSSRYAYVRYTDLEYGSTDIIGSALESDYILRSSRAARQRARAWPIATVCIASGSRRRDRSQAIFLEAC
jgi:hypothetical protein